MGKKGPPYDTPDDAQWIVVVDPPRLILNDGQIDYRPLEYWLRAIMGDQRAAKYIYEIPKLSRPAVIVELPSPEELEFPDAAYGKHSLCMGLKRRPWFNHSSDFAFIIPYNYRNAGHPEKIARILPMVSGDCEDEWLKLDLTIPYPTPQAFDFRIIPQQAIKFCRRPPDVNPQPPDAMEIDRYPTPPTQERQPVQNLRQPSRPRNEQPLFIPEDDSKPKTKNLDPYQEEESTSSFLRGTSSAFDTPESDAKPEPRLISVAEGPTPFNANESDRESNALQTRGDSRLTADRNELGNNPLSVKQEFANQDDTESQRMHALLQTVTRSQSPSEADRLSVKRELEKQDGDSAQKMFEVLNAANRGQGQGARGDRPSSGTVKRDPGARDVERGERDPSRDRSGPQAARYQASNRHRADDRSRDGHRPTSAPNSGFSSWRDRDERDGRERERERDRERDNRGWSRDGERGRGRANSRSGDRKRSFAYPDGRDDRAYGDRKEYPDKRSRGSYQ